MRLVVSDDTGPILHFSEASTLDMLRLTSEVHVPAAVETELHRLVTSWARPSWLTVDQLQEPYNAEAAEWQQAGLLDYGEAEAIGLARQLKADWLLTDDAAARLIAKGMEIEAHGSLGVVLWAAVEGHRKRIECEAALDALAGTSLWLSPRVLQEARTALGEIFGA